MAESVSGALPEQRGGGLGCSLQPFMPPFALHNSGIGVYTLCSGQGPVYELDFLGVFTNASTWLLHLGIAPSSPSLYVASMSLGVLRRAANLIRIPR